MVCFVQICSRVEGAFATMPLFGSSKKNPTEIVKVTMDALQVLEKESVSGKKTEKVSEFVLIKDISISFLFVWCNPT